MRRPPGLKGPVAGICRRPQNVAQTLEIAIGEDDKTFLDRPRSRIVGQCVTMGVILQEVSTYHCGLIRALEFSSGFDNVWGQTVDDAIRFRP